MNAEGGTLFSGVDDQGYVLGLKNDQDSKNRTSKFLWIRLIVCLFNSATNTKSRSAYEN
jgi:predicted HTH transcriptional regulator